MEGFYEKLIESVVNNGVFAVLFTACLVFLYRKYEGDIQRYRQKEDDVNKILLRNQEIMTANQTELSRILDKIDNSQNNLSNCINALSAEFKIFVEISKHKNGVKTLRRVK